MLCALLCFIILITLFTLSSIMLNKSLSAMLFSTIHSIFENYNILLYYVK